MKKPTAFVLFSSVVLAPWLSPLTALAQTPPAGASPPPESAANEAPAVPAEAPAPAETPAAPVPPAAAPLDPAVVEERFGVVEGKVDGTAESLAETKGAVDKLSKIKLGGYVQGRFESHGEAVNSGLTSTGGVPNSNRFYVKRARVKTVYDGTNAEFVFEVDATGDGASVKDTWAALVDTWTPLHLVLAVGQFKYPFGYELSMSSSTYEMPEQTLVTRKLFPGERDRGVRLSGSYDWLRFAVAVVNGNGTSDPIFGTQDQNTAKDLSGRVNGDFGWIAAGVSAYYGRWLKGTAAKAASLTWADKNMDSMITVDELSGAAAKAATFELYGRLRLGADLQLYFDVPEVGGLSIKSEFVYAKDTNRDYAGVAANKCKNVTSLGWYVQAVQNIGDHLGVVARVDSFDANYSKSLDDSCFATPATATLGKNDRVTTFGGGLLGYVSGNLKASFIYEHVSEEGPAIKNDVFTAQLQAKF